jgi:5-methylcytosine-specific restriction endonuclease McrA
MKGSKGKSVIELVKEYFMAHPRQDLAHGPVVDWVEEQYKVMHKKKPRDVWRAIRHLHEQGFLVKAKKGVYRYDPEQARELHSEDFTPAQKEAILRRDGYKCVICGRGEKDGVELHVDHIRPKYLGGKSTIENGQTLCARHNFLKKTLKQTETGKKMFIRLYELAKSEKNEELMRFCCEILETYEKHHINDHIVWNR